jgi:hypothetical protein
MSSYFDYLNGAIDGLSKAHDDDATFLECIGQIEFQVIETVTLVTGDLEFPDDLRERMQGLIATEAVCTTPGGLAPCANAIDDALTFRRSMLIDELHSAFHILASRNIETRFGRLSDNPRDIVTRRDAHDAEGNSNAH